MYQIDFHKPLHIHFIGIGGISMSGLAEILLGEDFVISGSDSKSSPLTQALEKKGATIYYGQRATNITDDVDVVVYTAAIHPDNPEFACAKEKGLPMLTRAELLGQIMRNYDTPVAISGTHGKTTTTSMVLAWKTVSSSPFADFPKASSLFHVQSSFHCLTHKHFDRAFLVQPHHGIQIKFPCPPSVFA